MIYSLALTREIHDIALNHLVREDGQEDLCFALWLPSQGQSRLSGLINQLILPKPGDRNVHGNVSFNPCYLERVLEEAKRAKCGIALIHSHPSSGWQDMSEDDKVAENRIAPTCFGATKLPLIGMTIGDDGAWSGRFWLRKAARQYEKFWCESVRVIGSSLDITFNNYLLPVPKLREELQRTVSAWGQEAQAKLSRVKVGIIGVGSVGSILAESLARMGISSITIIDFDAIERVNLDRILHSKVTDIGNAKVETLKEALKYSATSASFNVLASEYSICEEPGFRIALDCDVLFSCVDRPWPRFVLNQIAYAHFIPVIDGGIRIETNSTNTRMKRGDWRAHIVSPGRQCLECLGQYTPAGVGAEMVGDFDNPSYIENLPTNHFLLNNQNVFSFSLSLASFELQQFIMMLVSPAGVSDIGGLTYHFVSATLDSDHLVCKDNCITKEMIGKGDTTSKSYVDIHPVAALAREKRVKINCEVQVQESREEKVSWLQNFLSKLKNVFSI